METEKNKIKETKLCDVVKTFSFGTVEEEYSIKSKLKELEEIELKNRDIQKQVSFENSGIGEKFWHCTIDDFDCYNDELKQHIEKTKIAIKEINCDITRNLWFCGNNGNGKTMLASFIVKECFGHYVESYAIEDDLKDACSFNNSENRKQVFNRYKKYKVLVIDEVGRFPSDEEKKILFHILNDRYINNKSTVLISNLSKLELCEYLGKGIVDRFAENCECLVFNSPSYRIKIGKNRINN